MIKIFFEKCFWGGVGECKEEMWGRGWQLPLLPLFPYAWQRLAHIDRKEPTGTDILPKVLSTDAR